MYFKVEDVVGNVSETSNLEVIDSYSIDCDRRYCNDLSQLKYYKEPPGITNVNINLNRGGSSIAKCENNCKLDYIFRWMSDHFDLLKVEDLDNSRQWLQPEMVCTRGVLKQLFLTPFEKCEGWIICASKFKGTIYLCSFDTQQRIINNLNPSDYARASTSWGYKFEQHMLSDMANSDPNIEHCCVFKAQFDNTTLLYTGEMDGVISHENIKDTVVGKKITFVELKTIHEKEFKHGKVQKFIKILRWWCQSYLVGIQEIICGCKNYNGIVGEIKKVKLDEYHRIKEINNCRYDSNNFSTCNDTYLKPCHVFPYRALKNGVKILQANF